MQPVGNMEMQGLHGDVAAQPMYTQPMYAQPMYAQPMMYSQPVDNSAISVHERPTIVVD